MFALKTPQNNNIPDNRKVSLVKNKYKHIKAELEWICIPSKCDNEAPTINRSYDFSYCSCSTEILVSFPLRIVSLFFHYPFIRSQKHDGGTRGADTNLWLLYPMFMFPQASAGYVPDASGLPHHSKEAFLMKAVSSYAVQIVKESTQRLLVVDGITKKVLIQLKMLPYSDASPSH